MHADDLSGGRAASDSELASFLRFHFCPAGQLVRTSQSSIGPHAQLPNNPPTPAVQSHRLTNTHKSQTTAPCRQQGSMCSLRSRPSQFRTSQ